MMRGRLGKSRPGDQRAVGRDLVVLGPLAGGDQARVHRRLIEVLFHNRLAFFDDAGNAFAVLATNLLREPFEDLFQPLDLTLRFLEVRFKGLT